MSPTGIIPTVTVFSKNDCSDCTSVKNAFIRKGVPFAEINVENDTEPRKEFDGLTPLEYVIKTHGRKMPAVEATDDQWGVTFVGPRIDKIIEIVKVFRNNGQLIPEALRQEV